MVQYNISEADEFIGNIADQCAHINGNVGRILELLCFLSLHLFFQLHNIVSCALVSVISLKPHSTLILCLLELMGCVKSLNLISHGPRSLIFFKVYLFSGWVFFMSKEGCRFFEFISIDLWRWICRGFTVIIFVYLISKKKVECN